MNNLYSELHALEIENLKLVHNIEMNNLENRLKLKFDSQLNELKSDCEAKKEFDISVLRNKIEHLE